MANVKITELTAATALASTDVLAIVDVGADATKKVSVSDLLRNLPDGSAASPSLAFADDQNTGVLSPGNNSLAFATSGTQRLVIDSSGNVGIGDSSPSNALNVVGIADFDGIAGNTRARLRIQPDESTNTSFLDARTAVGSSQFAIKTGPQGGSTERFRIDGSGKVGIGISSPGSKLHVSDNTAPPLEITRDQAIGGSGILLRQPNTTDGNDLRISYESDTTGTGAASNVQFAAIEFTAATHNNSTRAGEIGFYTAKGGQGFIQRMRIDSNGQVGIGTSSPSSLLHIYGDSADTILPRVENNSASGNSAVDRQLRFGVGGGTAHGISIWQNSGVIEGTPTGGLALTAANAAGSIKFGTGASRTERMRIDNSGQVGIGITSPEDRLDLGAGNLRFKQAIGGTGTYGTIRAFNTLANTAPATSIRFIRDVATVGNDGAICFDTVNSERARIDSSGRLLLGHSSSRTSANAFEPRFQMEGINVTTSTAAIVRNENGTNGPILALSKSRGTSTGSNTIVQSGDITGAIHFAGADGTDLNSFTAWIQSEVDGTPGSNDMPGRLVFYTTADGASSPTERMRIDSEGRLHAGGTGAMQLGTICSRSTDGSIPSNSSVQRHTLSLGSTQTAALNVGPTIYFYGKTNNATADYGFAGIQGCKGSTASGNYTGHLRFFTQNSGGASNLSETCRMTQDGLTFFGDTAAVNALDDYEEGTFTPVLKFGGGTTGITYSRQEGHYTIVGRMVTAMLRITLTSKGTSTGALTITGLPASPGNLFSSTGLDGHCFLALEEGFNSSNIGGNTLIAYVDGGTDAVNMQHRNSSATTSTVEDHDVDNDFSVAITCIYAKG